MKLRPIITPPRVFLLILLLGGGLPSLLWRLEQPETCRVILADPSGEGEERRERLLWPFLYRKAEILGEGDSGEKGDVTLLAGSLTADFSDGEALLAVDGVKKSALDSRSFLCDGYTLTERVHSLFRNRLETFLQIERTGWVLHYERKEEARLVFSRDGREDVVLRGGTDFSGKPPKASLGGKSAPVYTWVPVYRAAGDAQAASLLELGLTEEGRRKMSEAGIPLSVPLIIEGVSPLVRTGFFAADLPPRTILGESYKIAGKDLFKSRFALFPEEGNDALYWRIYQPWINGVTEKSRAAQTGSSGIGANPVFSIEGQDFYLSRDGGEGEPFFIKGVNLGAALPGTWFTQFPEDEHLYYRWFTRMKEMNMNTLRIYTLFPPSFYRAFREFNRNNREDPLYLIHEIWPEEHPEGNDYLGDDYNRTYGEEIDLTVDALHGNRTVEAREGRAWGVYTADVSPWILAWLVGREMEPQEVETTNERNGDYVYKGRYISAPEGPAVESWLAASCDRAVVYETERYGVSRPVGIVSWPILDALHHEVEWNDPELAGREPVNDRVSVDINRIVLEDSSFGGFFGAYHIYPNYPDFMNNQSSYGEYEDEEGFFRYGGYLRDFMGIHGKYPALVAEYGISTSAAMAHYSPDGYHHGGLSEEEQARGIIRMTEAIRREGYAGGLVFEWIDEWAKKTWTTEPFMIPYDRQALWRNVMDPEQNYGVMAMKGVSEKGRSRYDSPAGVSLEVWGSESHLYLHMSGRETWEGTVYLGFDTYDREGGIRTFPGKGGAAVPTGMECLAVVRPEERSARLLTAEDYNLSTLSFRSSGREGQSFLPVEILTNRASRTEGGEEIPAYYTNWSILKYGPLDEAGRSFYLDDSGLTLRIPWTLLNVSDPSEGTVLDDGRAYRAYPERDVLETARSGGIRIYALIAGEGGDILARIPDDPSGGDGPVYRWETWDVPEWRQDEKKSVAVLAEYFAGLEDVPSDR